MKIIILFFPCMGFIFLINAMEGQEDVGLPGEHFEYIRVGSNFSVMIEGNHYAEYGKLYKPRVSTKFDNEYRKTLPHGAERVQITVVDSGVDGQLLRANHHFASKLERRNNVEEQVNQRSQCFIQTDDHVYRATLSLNAPDLKDYPSVVTLRGEFGPNDNCILYGVLQVYRPNARRHPGR